MNRIFSIVQCLIITCVFVGDMNGASQTFPLEVIGSTKDQPANPSQVRVGVDEESSSLFPEGLQAAVRGLQERFARLQAKFVPAEPHKEGEQAENKEETVMQPAAGLMEELTRLLAVLNVSPAEEHKATENEDSQPAISDSPRGAKKSDANWEESVEAILERMRALELVLEKKEEVVVVVNLLPQDTTTGAKRPTMAPKKSSDGLLDKDEELAYAVSRGNFTDVMRRIEQSVCKQLEPLEAVYRERLKLLEQQLVPVFRPVDPTRLLPMQRCLAILKPALQEQRSRWDTLLDTQQYAELDRELSTQLSSKEVVHQLEVHEWILQQLSCRLDPFLLYMTVRIAFNQPPKDHRVYFELFEHLMLCISLSEIARNVVMRLGLETSPGIGVADFAKTLKKKFVVKYNNPQGLLSKDIRERIIFSEVRDSIVRYLIDLAINGDVLVVLPLPHWVLRTKLTLMMGFETWRIDWAALTSQELAVRKNRDLMGTVVSNTKDAIEELAFRLQQLNSWEEFLEIV